MRKKFKRKYKPNNNFFLTKSKNSQKSEPRKLDAMSLVLVCKFPKNYSVNCKHEKRRKTIENSTLSPRNVMKKNVNFEIHASRMSMNHRLYCVVGLCFCFAERPSTRHSKLTKPLILVVVFFLIFYSRLIVCFY